VLKGEEPAVAVRTAVEWASWSTTVQTLEELLTPKK
jgi:hypothetical protein